MLDLALGSGGLKRLWRHFSLNHLHDKQPKWHVDYLLTSPDFSLVYAVCAVTDDRLECRIACELNKDSVPGFGSSDCSCRSSSFIPVRDSPEELLAAFRELRETVIKTIFNNPQVQDNI